MVMWRAFHHDESFSMNRVWSGLNSVLWRQRHQFSLRILFSSIVLASMAVVSITSISAILSNSLVGASSSFLAGDRQLSSPRTIPEHWLEKARSFGLSVAQSAEFSTMVSHQDKGGQFSFQLVTVKAVDEAYPLKGDLLVAESVEKEAEKQKQGPASGSVWLQGRLHGLLGISEKDQVSIGAKSFQYDGILAQEPDVGFQLSSFAPRLMIHLDDLGRTEVVQPGSRVKWQAYFVGPPPALLRYEEWLTPKLENSQKWFGLKEGRPAISDALDKAERYLLLGGSLSVLLAALAIAMSSKQFAQEQTNYVAIIKALGMRGDSLLQRYIIELALLGAVGVGIGWCLAALAINGWLMMMRDALPSLESVTSVLPPIRSLSLSLFTAFVFLAAFSLPQLSSLRHVAPMRVLRGGQQATMARTFARNSAAVVAAVLGSVSLLYWYGGNWLTVAIVFAGLLGIGLSVLLSHRLVLAFVARVWVPSLRSGGALKFTLQRVIRQRSESLLQLAVFSVAIFLFSVLLLTRTGLIDEWQKQLPDDAPNHFLINISPNALGPIKDLLSELNIKSTALYPMARGRLTHINGVDVKVAVTKDVGALNRELNLSWATELPSDNVVLEGNWWAEQSNKGEGGVSIESELAGKLNVGLGDALSFNLGGHVVEATVHSIRSVEWDSMRPNFYMLFPEGALNAFPATYITSFFLPKSDKDKLNLIAQQFPTVSVLELDELVSKIKSIVAQVSKVIELLLIFVFASTVLVLMALVAAGRKGRIQEALLMRTMGAKAGLLHRMQLYEFGVLGLLSSLVALAAAEAAVFFLKQRLFDGAFEANWMIWFLLPLASAAMLAVFGFVQTRHIPGIAPMNILRSKLDES